MLYPIGIQSFDKLREGGFVYVDKTDMVYKLAVNGGYYFFSRPRRFGKSLALSTMEAYFTGRKELFKGLAIEQLEKDWTAYPVLHIDLNTGKYDKVENLRNQLNLALKGWEELYGNIGDEREPSERFCGVIERAHKKTGKKVVVLIDEYDKPLLQNIGNEELQNKMRVELKAFYSVLKTQDRYIKFAFLTGVTKFSKVSVFSDLNNLKDISLSPEYERLCGISNDELEVTFHKSIQKLADENAMTYDEAKKKLKEKYDGYHFSRKMTDMYNPFSLLNAFSDNNFSSYWFETGTPTFLVELLRNNDIPLKNLEGKEMDELGLGNVDVMFTNPTPVLYQSGYLTLKGYDAESQLYSLGFPNGEVTDGFFKFLLPYYASIDPTDVPYSINEFIKDIRRADIDSFMIRLESFFADYNYELIPRHDLERHYQNVIFTVCKLIGLRVEAECHTSAGRIDMLIQTNDAVFIFEFKLNVPAKRALRQIERKDYAKQFAADKRKVYKIGVSFNSDIRSIENWVVG